MAIICVSILLDKQHVVTPGGVSLCTGSTTFTADFDNLSIFFFLLLDLVVSVILFYIFCSKLYEMARMVQAMDANQVKYKSMRQLERQLVKATILMTVTVLSTWCFMLFGNFVWWTLGWFNPLDVSINSLCIYFMFSFSKRTYSVCCAPCICCCTRCGCIDALGDATDESRVSRKDAHNLHIAVESNTGFSSGADSKNVSSPVAPTSPTAQTEMVACEDSGSYRL